MYYPNFEKYVNDDCPACPFSCSETAEYAKGLGCLPEIYEVMNIKREFNLNWACHDDTSKICAGFVAMAKDINLDYKSGVLIDTNEYLRSGKIQKLRAES